MRNVKNIAPINEVLNVEIDIPYKIIYNNDGTFNRVKIFDDIFKDNNGKSISKTIKNFLIKKIGESVKIEESGQKIYIGGDFPNEYAYSKSSQSLSKIDMLAKGRAISGLKGIIENAYGREFSNIKKNKHKYDAKYGFYKYNTKFSFEHNRKEIFYKGILLIRNDINGKKYIYDIINIKKIGNDLLPVVSNFKKS